MFVITTLVDTIRIPAHMLSLPTLTALHKEIDLKFPNRVLMDVGLVICRYGDCLKITNGTCVPGDGGCHHECLFRLVLFRPFVEEVCIGKISKSTAEGIHVSLGFFQDIFIPAYWMLRPSCYDEKIGLWVWTPDYDEEGGDDNDDDDEKVKDEEVDVKPSVIKTEPTQQNIKTEISDHVNDDEEEEEEEKVKEEGGGAGGAGGAGGVSGGDRFEMEIGAEIRFKVKSIQFTQVTNTAKGVQATTTTMVHSQSFPKESTAAPSLEEKPSSSSSLDQPIRRRSISVELGDSSNVPATMQIIASICEDGLGLTSWWTSQGGDDEAEEEEQEGGEEEEEVVEEE